MPALTPNIRNRVRKLPKPSNHAQGLQPLFEAVSNAVFAIEDRFDDVSADGHVDIQITDLHHPSRIRIEISDNGSGFDPAHFEAFCTIDTDFKRVKGGKGVGRLFWLDAFSSIEVISAYLDGGQLRWREFTFELDDPEQIKEQRLTVEAEVNFKQPGTKVIFKGLRITEYQDHFPKRAETLVRYLAAHFMSDFLRGIGPKVVVTIDGEATKFPDEVAQLVIGLPEATQVDEHVKFGDLQITAYTVKREASAGLEGAHQLHLLADGRTVESRKIDGLIGLKSLSRHGLDDLVLHACVSGEFLDKRVNEGRTAFNIPEKELAELTRDCVERVKETILVDQIKVYKSDRRASYDDFVARHPIYNFEDAETQLNRLPFRPRSQRTSPLAWCGTRSVGTNSANRRCSRLFTH